MVNDAGIRNCLVEIGLKPKEISELKIEDALNYLRFYHWRPGKDSSVLFLGFSAEEIECLSSKAKNCGLTVRKTVVNNLGFLCASENANAEKVEKARTDGAIILTKSDFDVLFDELEFSLHRNELFCNRAVPEQFRVARPLSNYDEETEVSSFSEQSENVYLVNLYAMTCTCKDFEKKRRNQYLKGDIRRLCKHLLQSYRFKIGVGGLSDLNRFIIENGYSVNKHFRYFNIERVRLPIAVNFESKDDWWNVFMANENGVYSRYGYSPIDKRFSYDYKPRGFVLELRRKLDELKYQLDLTYNNGTVIGKVQKGFAYLTMGIILLFGARGRFDCARNFICHF